MRRFRKVGLTIFAVALLTMSVGQLADTGQAGGRGGESGLVAAVTNSTDRGVDIVINRDDIPIGLAENIGGRGDCGGLTFGGWGFVDGGQCALPDGEGRGAGCDTRLAASMVWTRADCSYRV